MARNDYILREAIFIRTLSLMTDGAGLRKHKLTQFDESRREAGRLNLMCDKNAGKHLDTGEQGKACPEGCGE